MKLQKLLYWMDWTWNNKKELICHCCIFKVQVATGMLTNTNSQTGNKTRETSFLL